MSCVQPSSQAPGLPTPDEVWVAATCGMQWPDTTGWTQYTFDGIRIAVPAEYSMSRQNPRSIRFTRGTGMLTVSVSTSELAPMLIPRPARANWETACESHVGGYPATILSRVEGRRYTVTVDWDGRPFWEPEDWRKRLSATISASRLADATVLRQAVHTVRAVRDSSHAGGSPRTIR